MLGNITRWFTVLAMTTLLATWAACQEDKTVARHFSTNCI